MVTPTWALAGVSSHLPVARGAGLCRSWRTLCISIKSTGGNSSLGYTSLEPGIILSSLPTRLIFIPNLISYSSFKGLAAPMDTKAFSTPPTPPKLEFLLSVLHPFSWVALCEHTPQSTSHCICLCIRLPPSTPVSACDI